MEGILTSPLLSLIAERQLADPQDLEAIQGEHNMSGAAIPKLLHDQGVGYCFAARVVRISGNGCH